MNILIDDEGRVLGKAEIDKLDETQEGMALKRRYTIKMMLMFAANNALDYLENETGLLNRRLTAEERLNFCNVVYHCYTKGKWDKAEEYVAKALEDAKKVFGHVFTGNA
jgi:hypothetical protein